MIYTSFRWIRRCGLPATLAFTLNVHPAAVRADRPEPQPIDAENIPVEIGNLVSVPDRAAAVVVLVTQDRQQFIPITIGSVEAEAIWRSLNAVTPSRPLTHELLSTVIGQLGATVRNVVITELDQGTFKANLVLELRDGSHTSVDARPSDLIALALKSGAPLSVTPAVLREAGQDLESQPTPVEPERPRPPDPEPRRPRPPRRPPAGMWL